ncbi:hypothetical protein QCD71_10590 [Sphingomonas sp. PsM26]|nr:hypothetical protein [Sphingomonas sp. PsM26]
MSPDGMRVASSEHLVRKIFGKIAQLSHGDLKTLVTAFEPSRSSGESSTPGRSLQSTHDMSALAIRNSYFELHTALSVGLPVMRRYVL